MQKKLCSECGEIAEVSLCQILSTVGRTPRRQRCSMSTSFCAPCLHGRIKLLRRLGLHGIQKPLSEAFTTLTDGCGMRLSRPRGSRSVVGDRESTFQGSHRRLLPEPATAVVRLEEEVRSVDQI